MHNLLAAVGVLVLLATGLSGQAAAAVSEPSLFIPGEARVIDAHVFVNEPDGQQYTLKRNLVLTIRATAEAKRFAGGGFRVRIFALDADGKPHVWAFFDPCFVFLSSVSAAVQVHGHSIDLGSLQSLSWLSAQQGEPMHAGRFLLVFETNTDSDALFRLSETDQVDYFSRALHIEIDPDRDYSAAEVEQQAELVAQRTENISRTAQNNSPDSTCYRAKLAQGVAQSDVAVASLGRCGSSH
jgi:hypothetical protein